MARSVPTLGAHYELHGFLGQAFWYFSWWMAIPGTTGVTASDMALFIAALDTTAADLLVSNCSTDVNSRLSRLHVYTPGEVRSDMRFSSFTGGVHLTSAPAVCAQCVTLVTGTSGRGAFGRIFLPGVPAEDIVEASLWDALAFPHYVAGALAWLEAVNAISQPAFPSVEVAVLRRTIDGVPQVPPGLDPVVQARVSRRVCTQDRRGHVISL